MGLVFDGTHFWIIVLHILARYPRAIPALDECNVGLSVVGPSSAISGCEA